MAFFPRFKSSISLRQLIGNTDRDQKSRQGSGWQIYLVGAFNFPKKFHLQKDTMRELSIGYRLTNTSVIQKHGKDACSIGGELALCADLISEQYMALGQR